MSFSVIVPTWNSVATLQGLLEDLVGQALPPAEIIIADGQSSDATTRIAERFGARVVTNPVRHAAGGRNRGAAVATQAWLAFTDSDCRLRSDWLACANALIAQNHDLVALAGPMCALPHRNEIERVAGESFLRGVMRFPTESIRPQDRSLRGAFITANVFYRRDIFHAVGGFDEWFQNNAEDIDLFWRILARFPGQLLYDPSLTVYHCFPTTLYDLFRKWYGFGIASCRLQKRHLGKFRVDGFHYRQLVITTWRFLRRPEDRPASKARIVQLTGHLCGKYSGSFRFGIINL